MSVDPRSPTRRPRAAGPRRAPPRPARRPTARTQGSRAEPGEEPRGRSRLTARAGVLLLVLLVLVISYASSLRAWLQQRAEIEAARADIARTQASVNELEREKQRWEDPAYVQQQARERFGWVLPGEVGYRVIDADGTTLGAPAPPAILAEQPPSDDWYDDVWGSIRAAGAVQEQSDSPRPQDEVITPPARSGGRGGR